MSDPVTKFWQERDEYHDLVEQFDQGFTIVHADTVTSRRMCPCLEYMSYCGFPLEGEAAYYEYRGPRLGP